MKPGFAQYFALFDADEKVAPTQAGNRFVCDTINDWFYGPVNISWLAIHRRFIEKESSYLSSIRAVDLPRSSSDSSSSAVAADLPSASSDSSSSAVAADLPSSSSDSSSSAVAADLSSSSSDSSSSTIAVDLPSSSSQPSAHQSMGKTQMGRQVYKATMRSRAKRRNRANVDQKSHVAKRKRVFRNI